MTKGAARGLATEFFIIVLGVLTALGVDEWRETRRERARESQYVSRLISDLVQDSATMATAVRVGGSKGAALDTVLANLHDTAAVRRSPSLAWPDINFTYARPELQTTTFNELTASGSLGLLRDANLREEIGKHYLSVAHHYQRLDDRRSRIAWKLAELFPGTVFGAGAGVDMDSLEAAFFAAPLTDVRMDELLGMEYQGLLNQERIYARSMEDISSSILDRTGSMLASLRAYQTSIQ